MIVLLNPIIQFGAIPVFIDVDLLTHNIDVDKIIDWVNKQSKEIKADIISVVKSADEKLAGA